MSSDKQARQVALEPSAVPVDGPGRDCLRPADLSSTVDSSVAEGRRRADEPWEKKRRQLEELAEKHEAAKVYQLALWPEEKRAMPFDFVACALFSAIQEKDATFCNGVEIANANGVRITFKGKRLTQVHADVWEGIMHLARGCQEGTRLRFRSRQFLRLIGRHTGKSQREQLHAWITDLVATNIEVIDQNNRRRYFGSLLPEGARDDSAGGDSAYVVEINRHLCKLFERGHATINWEQRQKLRGKWLALWLQHYFAKFRKPVAVAELHRLSGTATTLKDFRRKLRIALQELEGVGGHRACIEKANDSVIPKPEPLKAPDISGSSDRAPSAQGAPAPRISARAKAQFAKAFPEHASDCDQCVTDFWAWLAKKERTADKPDAAFLGFAKKWVGAKKPAANAAV